MKKIGLLLICILLLSSCDLLVGRLAGEYGVKLEPDEVIIGLGKSDDVELTIEPISGVALTVDTANVKLLKAPEGVSIDPETLSLPTGINSRSFTVTVSKDATVDDEAEIELEVVRGDIGKIAILKLIITE